MSPADVDPTVVGTGSSRPHSHHLHFSDVHRQKVCSTFSMNVLLIEDDKRIAGLVERGLRENGHRVSISHNGTEGAQLMLEGAYDAALLDILLPGMDGLAVLEKVRLQRCKTPILMLTAVDAVPKLLEAFDLGADDYLVKPFLLEVLLARVGAIARRTRTTTPPILEAGGIALDCSKRVAV